MSAADPPVGRLQMCRRRGRAACRLGAPGTAPRHGLDSIPCRRGTPRLVITVVTGTDAANVPRDYPTNVRVTARETGLPKDTAFLCFQIRALDPSRFRAPRAGLVTPAGQLPPIRMVEVDAALRAVLSL